MSLYELFRDVQARIDPGDTPYRTHCDRNKILQLGEAGYYLFDDLPEGDYVVRLAPENFQPDDIGTTVVIDGHYSESVRCINRHVRRTLFQ